MKLQDITQPDFLLVGAQKSGTTWLWRVLDQHSGTDLPRKKEIHFFGGAENYRKGKEWYYNHFEDLDSSKVIGEASTTYLYDNVPFWYNLSNSIEVDCSLPTIPELITNELPNIKILVILRDPVWRAVSAYKHCMRKIKRVRISPRLGLRKTAIRYPKMRILEYGYYARYLKLWKKFVHPEQMLILIFEEDVVKSPEKTVRCVYDFLGMDSDFQPEVLHKPVHKSWSWTRIVMHYYAASFSKRLAISRVVKVFDRFDFLRSRVIKRNDIEFLRSIYLPERQELEAIIGRDLACWDYGEV